MKAFNTKKILRCAVFSLMICAVLTVGFIMNALHATAHETDEFTFVGASVRLDKDGETSGLRFTADFGASLYDRLIADGQYRSASAELGMIIVPDSYIREYEASEYDDYFTFFSEVKGKSKGQISTQFAVEQMINVAEDTYRISGALVSIKYANYEREFRPIVYYTENGTDLYYQAGTEPKSISNMSISAIERDKNELSLTDKELDILYKYADGWIPRVIYDASRGDHISKLLNMPILADGDSNWTALRENVNIDGVDYFKISAETLGTSSTIAVSYVLPDDFDISKYDFVVFDATYNRDGIRIGLCDTKSADLYETGVWSTTTANVPNTAIMSSSYFISQANGGQYSLTAKLLQPDDACLIGDFVAYGVKSIEKMISTLPTEGYLTREQKNTVDELKRVFDATSMIYNNYAQRISNYDRYLAALNLPHAIHDASYEQDKDVFKLLTVPTEEAPYRAEVTQVVYGGYEMFKLTMLEKGSADIVPIVFNSPKINTDIYSKVHFGIYTEHDGVVLTFAETADPTNRLPGKELTKYKIEALHDRPSSLPGPTETACFAIVGLEAGESVYFTDFTLFNKDSVRMMVEALPLPENVTEDDREAVELAKKFYDLLDDTDAATSEKTYADPDGKLAGCIAVLEQMPYPIIGYSKTNSESIFNHVDEFAGVKCDKASIEKEVLYNKEWFKFTPTEINGPAGMHTQLISLESLGLALSERVFDYVIFDIRLGNNRAFMYDEENGVETDIIVSICYPETNEEEIYLSDVTDFKMTGPGTAMATVKGELLQEKPFHEIYLLIMGSELNESVYISSILGINLEQVKAMVDNLPSPEMITEADRPEFNTVYHYYQHIILSSPSDAEKIDPDGKLADCKIALDRLPYVLYPADSKYPETHFKSEQIIGDEGSELELTIHADGTHEYKVLKLGHMNAIGLSYSVDDIDLSAYDNISFNVTTTGTGIDGTGVECNVTAHDLSDIGKWETLTPNEPLPILINAQEYVQATQIALLSVKNLKVGDTVCITPITAYNLDALNSMVRTLPTTDGRTVEDMEKLEKIYTLINMCGYSTDDVDTATIDIFDNLPMLVYDTGDPEMIENFVDRISDNYTLESVTIGGYSWLKITANEGVTETDKLLLKLLPKDIPYCEENDDIFFRLKADGAVKSDGYVATLDMALDTDLSANIDGYRALIHQDEVGYAQSKTDFINALTYATLSFSGVTAGESIYISSSIVVTDNTVDADGNITTPGTIIKLANVLSDGYIIDASSRATLELINTISEVYSFTFPDAYAIEAFRNLLLPEEFIDISVPASKSCVTVIEGSFNGMPAASVSIQQYQSGKSGWMKITKDNVPENTAPIFLNFSTENAVLPEGADPNESYVVFRIRTDAEFNKLYGEGSMDYAALISLIERNATSIDGKTNTTVIRGGSNERVCVFRYSEFISITQYMTGLFEGVAPGESIYISDFAVYSADLLSTMEAFAVPLEEISADDLAITEYLYALSFCLGDVTDDPTTTENEEIKANELNSKILIRLATAIMASLPEVNSINHSNTSPEQLGIMYELNETVWASGLTDEMRTAIYQYIFKYRMLKLPAIENINSAADLSQYDIEMINNLRTDLTFAEVATDDMKDQLEGYYAKLQEYGIV